MEKVKNGNKKALSLIDELLNEEFLWESFRLAFYSIFKKVNSVSSYW